MIVGFLATAIIGVVAIPFLYRSYQLVGLPDIGDPFDVQAFGTVEIEDADNACIEYREAADVFSPLPYASFKSLEKALESGWPSADAQIRQWLADNRDALI